MSSALAKHSGRSTKLLAAYAWRPSHYGMDSLPCFCLKGRRWGELVVSECSHSLHVSLCVQDRDRLGTRL